MKDLLVNTGRAGSHGYKRSRFKNIDPDLLPPRFSITEFIGYKRSMGDRLNPLYRFLERNCGRKWSDVYSEICEVADHRTVRGYHLRQHVHDYVLPTINPIGLGWRRYGPFFVDANGLLQKEPSRTNAQRRAENKRWQDSEWDRKQMKWVKKIVNPKIADTADHWWEKVEGFWYEFTVTRTTHPRSMEDLAMVNGEVEIIRIKLKDYIHEETKKRQVDSKMSKKLEAMFQTQKAA